MVLIDVFATRKLGEFEGANQRFGRELLPLLSSSWLNIDRPTGDIAWC